MGRAQPELVGLSHLVPIPDCTGFGWQELKGGGLAVLRVGSVEENKVLLGAHHATASGHSDCCLQVVP